MRLFVAAELPAAVADALLAVAPLEPALRPVPRESLHITLAFLGARSEPDVDAIRPTLADVARPVSGLTLRRSRWLPSRRPGVLAVELHDPTSALRELQADLVRGLIDAIGFEPERRPFLPHVTVARVRRGARPPGGASRVPEVAPFAVPCVTLFESRSSSQGSRYLALERVRLQQ